MSAARTLALLFSILLIPVATAQPGFSPARTPDGHPDFQGNWASRWTTPLERLPNAKTLIISAEDGAKLHQDFLARLTATDPLAPEYAWDLTGPLVIRGGVRSSLVVDPEDGRLPLTSDGRARRTAFRPFTGDAGPEQRGLNERCLMAGNGYAPFLSIPAANIRQIVQTPDTLLFHTEAFNQLRIVPLDGRPSPAIPRGGLSSGAWEGDTLVITTKGFLPADGFRISPGSTFPISPATRISERLTLISADEILYSFTVEDAGLYTRAWTAESLLKRTGDRMFEWACHEANYGLAGILSGGRVTEARASAH